MQMELDFLVTRLLLQVPEMTALYDRYHLKQPIDWYDYNL